MNGVAGGDHAPLDAIGEFLRIREPGRVPGVEEARLERALAGIEEKEQRAVVEKMGSGRGENRPLD